MIQVQREPAQAPPDGCPAAWHTAALNSRVAARRAGSVVLEVMSSGVEGG